MFGVVAVKSKRGRLLEKLGHSKYPIVKREQRTKKEPEKGIPFLMIFSLHFSFSFKQQNTLMFTRSSFLLLGYFSCSASAAQCTMDELQEFMSRVVTPASTSFNVCVTSSGFDCSKDCRNKLREYSSVTGSIDCEIDGTNHKNAMDDIVESYNTQCGTNGGASGTGSASGTNGDASGSHGYSAAHYMLAILVPMALLCLL